MKFDAKLSPLEELAAVDLNYKHVTVKLIGEDGNVFSIIGRCLKSLRRAGAPKRHMDIFKQQVTSGDYDHALQVVMEWFTISGRCGSCSGCDCEEA